MNEKDLMTARQWVEESQRIVFFGGAGTSTAAGIPDFRSEGGLYNQPREDGLSPEYMLSHEYLVEQPDAFSRGYKKNRLFQHIKPSVLHEVLVQWEKGGKLAAIITQNIDGLHQRAGSKNVIELHGNYIDHYCVECGKEYDVQFALQFEGAAACEACGGFVRPDVTLYGEMLPGDAMERALEALAHADMLIVAGTSLVVYPAAGLLRNFRGNRMVLINRQVTAYDGMAGLVFREDIGSVLDAMRRADA